MSAYLVAPIISSEFLITIFLPNNLQITIGRIWLWKDITKELLKSIDNKQDANILELLNLHDSIPTDWKIKMMIDAYRKCFQTFNDSFPVEGDKVTFIGSSFIRFGEKEPFLNHIICLGSC